MPRFSSAVCTTELGHVANLAEEFAKRNTKVCATMFHGPQHNHPLRSSSAMLLLCIGAALAAPYDTMLTELTQHTAHIHRSQISQTQMTQMAY